MKDARSATSGRPSPIRACRTRSARAGGRRTAPCPPRRSDRRSRRPRPAGRRPRPAPAGARARGPCSCSACTLASPTMNSWSIGSSLWMRNRTIVPRCTCSVSQREVAVVHVDVDRDESRPERAVGRGVSRAVDGVAGERGRDRDHDRDGGTHPASHAGAPTETRRRRPSRLPSPNVATPTTAAAPSGHSARPWVDPDVRAPARPTRRRR